MNQEILTGAPGRMTVPLTEERNLGGGAHLRREIKYLAFVLICHLGSQVRVLSGQVDVRVGIQLNGTVQCLLKLFDL